MLPETTDSNRTPDLNGRSAGETAILRAAAQLFSTIGYDGVSMRSVAEAAGVSKANIYHHFASKEALYLEILHARAGELETLVRKLEASTGDFDASIGDFALAHLQHLMENDMASRLMIREAFSGDDERSRMLVERVVGGIYERMVAIFEQGQRSGSLRRELDPALCAMLLMGADVFFFQARDVLRHVPAAGFATSPGEFSRQMVDILLHGMRRSKARGGRS